jgi:putative flippase GtrA
MRRGERAMYLSVGVVFVPLASAVLGAPVGVHSWALAPLVVALAIIALVGNVSAVRRFIAIGQAADARALDGMPASASQLLAPKLAPTVRFALFRHQIAALAATSIDFVTMFTLVELFAAAPSHATLVGASAGAGANFVLGRKYTFPDSEGSVAGQLVRYTVVAGMSALLNAFGVWMLGRFGVPYGGARLATALVVSVAWNFPMHRAFVFAPPAEEASGDGPIGERVRS